MTVGLIAALRLAQAFVSAGDNAPRKIGVPPRNRRQTSDHATWVDIHQSS
jgi:hypothetical protein